MKKNYKAELVKRNYKYKKNPRSSEEPRGNTPVGAEGFEPPTLCL